MTQKGVFNLWIMILESLICMGIWTICNEEVMLRLWVWQCLGAKKEEGIRSRFSKYIPLLASFHHTTHVFPRLHLFAYFFFSCMVFSLSTHNVDLFLTYIFEKCNVSKYFENITSLKIHTKTKEMGHISLLEKGQLYMFNNLDP